MDFLCIAHVGGKCRIKFDDSWTTKLASLLRNVVVFIFGTLQICKLRCVHACASYQFCATLCDVSAMLASSMHMCRN